LWRRPRPKLGCGAKEGRKEGKMYLNTYSFYSVEELSLKMIKGKIVPVLN
jgi:hypothetical protein